jgi:methyl-accepting chemotaxis protein
MSQKNENVFRYIIDGSDAAGGDNFSALGFEEDIGYWDKAALKAFATGTIQMGTIDQNDKYGATISAYEPIFGESGEIIGLIACDVDAAEIVKWVKTQVVWQLGIVFIMLVVGLAVYLTLISLVNKSFS